MQLQMQRDRWIQNATCARCGSVSFTQYKPGKAPVAWNGTEWVKRTSYR
jgi:hypothetical protein